LREELVEIEGESRLTVVAVDGEGSATGFSEPGPVVTAEEWNAAHARISDLIGSAAAVVLSGSLPPGVPLTHTRSSFKPPIRSGCRRFSMPRVRL
jgi:tagatose 6-phosphate kinase